MERFHSDSNLGEKDFCTIQFLFDQQQFLPNQQKLLLEPIFLAQFPKRMWYKNHPWALSLSEVFHQDWYRVLKFYVNESTSRTVCVSEVMNPNTYPCNIIPSKMTQFGHLLDQCEVIKLLSCLPNHHHQSVLFILRVFTGLRTKTNRLSDQSKLILFWIVTGTRLWIYEKLQFSNKSTYNDTKQMLRNCQKLITVRVHVREWYKTNGLSQPFPDKTAYFDHQ